MLEDALQVRTSPLVMESVRELSRMAIEQRERMRPLFEVAERHKNLIENLVPAAFLNQITEMGVQVTEALSKIKPAIGTALRDMEGFNKAIESMPGHYMPTSSVEEQGQPLLYLQHDTYIHLHPEDQRDIIEQIVERIAPAKMLRNRAEYVLPKDAIWGKLRMQFTDGHTVKVKYPGLSTSTFDYKEMGFLNRKTNNPDAKWEFLRDMAYNNGMWSPDNFRKGYHRTAKYQLSQRLKLFFKMGTDPFEPYKKRVGYRVRFVLLSDSSPSILADDERNLMEY